MNAALLTYGIAGLVMGQVLVTALLLALLLRTRWSWRLKSAAIVLGTLLCVVAYESWPSLLGWPSTGDLPQKFNLVAVHVQPPDELTGAEGAIYLWITEMGEHNPKPRAFKLPFEPLLRARVTQAKLRLGKNIPQVGEKKEEGEGDPTLRAIGTGDLGQRSAILNFYDLPTPPPPEK